MFTKLLTLSALFVSAFCLSIGTVSERNVTKREANAEDLFPDWVPFKNKHGDELGEFVQVKKNKVKKRLAPPVNFLLRAVADAEAEDYYDKGPGGENDAEDYYEKKEWSDVNRPAQDVDKKHIVINHSDISDIDGVVKILTKSPMNPIIETYEASSSNNKERHVERKFHSDTVDTEEHQSAIDRTTTTSTTTTTTETPVIRAEASQNDEIEENPIDTNNKKQKEKKYINNEEENEEYEEELPRKSNGPSEENKEDEDRKAKILSSVDDLKARHAEEQRELTEKIKGEDMFKDEFGKEPNQETPDRFLSKSSEESKEPSDRYKKPRRKYPTTKPDYDEYEDLDSNKGTGNKYNINVLKFEPEPSSAKPVKTNEITTNSGRKKEVHIESGKISVFRNPQLFVMYDDSDETTTDPAKQIFNNRGPKRFSSKYTITPASSDERISLVPADSKEGEPTLFFPKTRKYKKKKVKSTTPPQDSTVAETVTDNYNVTTAYDVTVPDFGGRTEDVSTPITTTVEDTDTTGTDTVTVKSDVTDAIPAPSEHKKENDKNEDYVREKGGAKEHHEEHDEEHEEHGKKAYQGHHDDTKTAKGYHNKENHLGKYDDHGGIDKTHVDESGHYGHHHHEEHGKKHAKYEESGKHSKGHSTKGSHDIHKKEEYEKKVEFFEEEGDSDEEEKHGGYNEEKGHEEAGRFKKGNLKAEHYNGQKGESAHFSKGGQVQEDKGHKQAAGHDSHGNQGADHFQKGALAGGRKWIFHHGQPAKNANLVVIDRVPEQYYHGPHYYG